MIGYLRTNTNILERVLLFIAAILLLVAGLQTDLIGVVLLAVVYGVQFMRTKNEKTNPAV
jgi:UPF0716 family protein affecting phage T7 exclusion